MQLRERQGELQTAQIQVAIVTFEVDGLARNYVRQTNLTWPLLVDRERKLYHAYGMNRESRWRVLGPASWGKYLRLILRGQWPKLPTDDPYQMGGDVLIDREGIVRLHYISRTPADRPSVESILAVATSFPYRSGPAAT